MQKFWNSNLGKALKGATAAYAGYAMATATGGNELTNVLGAASTYTGIDSMFSGAASKLGGLGPYVAAAAALFTLFSHHDNPGKMPDKYDTVPYGTAIANLLGSGYNGTSAMTANGQQFTENPSLNQQLGGVGELSYISSWIKSNPAEAVKILGQATVSMLTGATSITGGKDGNLTLNNGQTVNWQTLTDAANQATNAIMQFGNSALSASQNAATLAASFTSLILGGPAGFSIPLLLGAAGLGGTISGSTSLTGGASPARSPRHGSPIHSVHVSLLQGATITKDIASEVQAALPALATQITSIVNQANYQQNRLFGNYVSAVA